MSTATITLEDRLQEALIRGSGVTIAPDGTEPTTGYVVAVPGAESRTNDVPDISLITAWSIWTASRKVAELARRGLKAFYGAWQDGKHSYLDVCVIFTDRAEAMNRAREWGQLAIFDLGARQEIRVG